MAPGELQHLINDKTVHWVQSREEHSPGQGPQPWGTQPAEEGAAGWQGRPSIQQEVLLDCIYPNQTVTSCIPPPPFCLAGDNFQIIIF